VLEVGCGMATQTFEGGLWEAIGPTGSDRRHRPRPRHAGAGKGEGQAAARP